jgi:hypothetical protein
MLCQNFIDIAKEIFRYSETWMGLCHFCQRMSRSRVVLAWKLIRETDIFKKYNPDMH